MATSDTTATKLARVEEIMNGLGNCIRDIKARLDKGDDMLTAIYTLTEQNKRILEEMRKHDERITALEKKPMRYWETAVIALITAVAGGGVGWLISAIR